MLRRTVLAVGLLLVLTAGACASEPTFDRAAAVDRVVRDSGGQLSSAQAECYVDRVVAEIGSNALAAGVQARPEHLPQLTRIRVDCTGVASLGTAVATTATTADANLGSRPLRPGDDPDLDALYDACGATGGTACDELFDRSVLGSTYEEFASTCGGRTKEASCAAIYDATSTTTRVPPSPTSATTSRAPTTTTPSTRLPTTTVRR